MSDPLDPEEGADDSPYCESVPGLEPHNFQAVTDLFGSGIWLYCTQCGDHYQIDGTAAGSSAGLTPGQLPLPTHTGTGSAPPQNSPPPNKPSGFPFP